MSKYIEPSVSRTAFNCPYCGTLTTQVWSKLYADRYGSERKCPPMPDESVIERFRSDKELDKERKDQFINFIKRLMSGELFYEKVEGSVYPQFHVSNLNISECYECHKLSIWLHDRLLSPNTKTGIEPNVDLDDDIKKDFNEAREIIDLSPRGAAALLRLSVQKLCKQLGESGKNIDDDIGSLVGKGLSPVIQKSLDVVRVIGNEAVHPGTLDLRDDRDTAVHLLKLINSIADQMISHPKQVDALYEMLPESKREGIQTRNNKALAKTIDATTSPRF